MTSTRVLFVNHSSKHAGAEIVLRDVAMQYKDSSAVWLFEDGPYRSLLQDYGIKVILAANSKDLSLINRKDNLVKSILPLLGNLSSMTRQIAREAKKYDIVYANSQKAFVLSSLSAKFARKKLIWHLHDILSTDHFSNMQIKLDIKLANALAACVIVPSEATADAFIRAGGNSDLVHVVHNGVNVSHIGTTLDKKQLRAELGLPDGFIYGVFSRLSPWKGQHVAVRALRALPADVHCLIVGDAQFGEDQYKKSLYSLVEELGLKDRVIFMGHRSDVLSIMKAVDVYCHPSVSPEPFSLAILEAMSCKLPIIASNAGGIPEVIENGVSGILFSPGNAAELSKMLNDLRIRTEVRYELGNNAYHRVINNFTIEQMQDKISNIIEKTAHPERG